VSAVVLAAICTVMVLVVMAQSVSQEGLHFGMLIKKVVPCIFLSLTLCFM